MKLKIYNNQGGVRVVLSPADSSTLVDEVQDGSFISLSATHTQCVVLEVNDYAIINGKKYYVDVRYTPKMMSTKQWQYSIQLLSDERLLNRYLIIKSVDGDNDAVFSYTAPAHLHMKLIVDCINKATNSTEWKVGEVIGTENIVMEYTGAYALDSLKNLARKAGTECWFDGKTVNLSKCEVGAPLTLGYKQGLTNIDIDKANNVKLFTRLFPLGSKRNIVPSEYGDTRLQLPTRAKYITQDVDKYGVIDHFEEKAFEHIYPRRVGNVTAVRSEERIGKDNKNFKVYFIKDSGMTFNPNELEIGGLVKHIVFQSGELNGRDFEVNYNDSTKEIEIITQFPTDKIQLPNDTLTPAVGDTYIIYNIKMPREYYSLAEQELAKAVEKYVADNRRDIAVYKCKSDFVYMQSHNVELCVGQRINLVGEFLDEGSITTRVTKLTRKLNNLHIADIEMSDVVNTTSLSAMSQRIDSLDEKAREASLAVPNIIKSWEKTPLGDTNIMSSKRVIKEIEDNNDVLAGEFLNKKKADTAQEHITFAKGITTLNAIIEQLAQIHQLSVDDVANIVKLVISGELKSDDYSNTDGFKIFRGANGWSIEIDNIIARKTFKTLELVVQRVIHQGGMIIQSPAGGKLTKKHSESPHVWVFYVDTKEYFQRGDLLLCQTFIGEKKKRYWRLVDGYNSEKKIVFIRKNDCEAESAIPEEGDEVAVLGNKYNLVRQNARIINVVGLNAPYTADYKGINTYSLQGRLISQIGNLSGVNDSHFGGELSGVGAYFKNLFAHGKIVLSSGESIELFVTNKANSAEQKAITKSQEAIKATEGELKKEIKNTNDNLQVTRSEVLSESDKRINEAKKQIEAKVKEDVKAGITADDNGNITVLGKQIALIGTTLAERIVVQGLTAKISDVAQLISDNITTKRIEVKDGNAVMALIDAPKKEAFLGNGAKIGKMSVISSGLRAIGTQFRFEASHSAIGKEAHLSTWSTEASLFGKNTDGVAVKAQSKRHTSHDVTNKKRVALEVEGGVNFNVSRYDHWRIPGILWVARVNKWGNIEAQWGDGLTNVRVWKVGNGAYQVSFSGSDMPQLYFPQVVPHTNEYWSSAWVTILGSDYFTYETVDTGQGKRDIGVIISILGVPKTR